MFREISIRDTLWKKAINASVQNVIPSNETSRIERIVNDTNVNRLHGRVARWKKNGIVVDTLVIAKVNDNDKLVPHPLVKNDVWCVNNDIDMTLVVTKFHKKLDIDKRYIVVKPGDNVKKGEALAYREKPYYVKLSRLTGKVKDVYPTKDGYVVVVEREYDINEIDGIKVIGMGDQKGTTYIDKKRFVIRENDEQVKRLADKLESLGCTVRYVNNVGSYPSLVGDMCSVFKRKNMSYIANLSLGMEDDSIRYTADETYWNNDKVVYLCSVEDTVTNEMYVGIYGIGSYVIGAQTPDYELRVPNRLNPFSGQANGTSIDIFGRYVIRDKFGETFERLMSNNTKIDVVKAIKTFDEIMDGQKSNIPYQGKSVDRGRL